MSRPRWRVWFMRQPEPTVFVFDVEREDGVLFHAGLAHDYSDKPWPKDNLVGMAGGPASITGYPPLALAEVGQLVLRRLLIRGGPDARIFLIEIRDRESVERQVQRAVVAAAAGDLVLITPKHELDIGGAVLHALSGPRFPNILDPSPHMAGPLVDDEEAHELARKCMQAVGLG